MRTSAAFFRMISKMAWRPHDAWLAATGTPLCRRRWASPSMSCMRIGCSTYSRWASRIRLRIRIALDGLQLSFASTRKRGRRAYRLTGAAYELHVPLLADADLVEDRREALLHRLAGSLDHQVEVLVGRNEVHGVEDRAHLTAHEPAHGLLEVLARRVPAGHVESAQDEAGSALEGVPAVCHHLGHEPLGVEGRLSDVLSGHLVEHRPDHPGVGPHGDDDLAQARDAGVGVELHEADRVAVSKPPRPELGLAHRDVDERELCAFDSHGGLLPFVVEVRFAG